MVNTGEMRLFYFVNNGTQVYTYPIGMGVLDYKTPTGNFTVNQKKVNPDLAHTQAVAGKIPDVGDARRAG